MNLSRYLKLMGTTAIINATALVGYGTESSNNQTTNAEPMVSLAPEQSTWDVISDGTSNAYYTVADTLDEYVATPTMDHVIRPVGSSVGLMEVREDPMRPEEYERQQAEARKKAELEALYKNGADFSNPKVVKAPTGMDALEAPYRNGVDFSNPKVVEEPETSFLEDVGDVFVDIGDGIADGAEWTYDNALKPAGQGIAAGAEWTYDNALKPAGQEIADGAEWTYDNALKPAGQGIAAGAEWTYDNA